MPHTPGIGAIFGIVSENGSAKSGGRVGLYDRSTMQLVAKTLADSLGGYQFAGLNQTTNDYLVMALDDDGSPAKNALVQDYIQPIPAHMGAVAYCNWYWSALNKDPIALWIPRWVSSLPAPSTTSYNVAAASATGAWYENVSSITPGAPQIPATTLNTGIIITPIRARAETDAFAPTNTTFSLEWVMDTTQSGTLMAARNAYGGANPVTYPTPALGIAWTRSSSNLTWGLTSTDTSSWSWVMGSTNWIKKVDYNNSALNDGVHHFVIAIKMGIEAKLYVDGTLVQTTSLVGLAATMNGHPMQMYLCGPYATGIVNGNCKSGPYAWYRTQLSQSDVTAHYNALMVGSSPLVTGYLRDVVTDEPSCLVRCNAGTVGTETDPLCNESLTHYGSVTVQQASAVTGGAMTAFGGGVLYGRHAGGGALAKIKNTIEFWINPDDDTPAATGTVIAARRSDETTYHWRVTQLVTTGKITALVRLSTSSDETINFNYAPPQSTNTLIAITIDKLAGEAKLYANGVLYDTQTITVGYLYQPAYDADTIDGVNWISSVLHVGGLRTAAGVVSAQFYGKLGEIAVYPRLLTVDRLLSHYAARTLT